MQHKISLIVITKNEENHIERCLSSVPWAAEKIVVDSYSTDKTCEIAQRLGAKVYQEKWRGFGPQKRKATELASHDWILSLDADEALSPELAEEILRLSLDPSKIDGYQIPRKSFHLGRWILHGGWYPDYQLRLYHRGSANWTTAEVHERVVAKNVGRLKQSILHLVFDDLSDQVQTNNRYSTLGALELEKNGKSFSVAKLIFKPLSKFFETYIFKRGFRDGLPGLIIAVGAAYSVFLKFAKLWESKKVPGSFSGSRRSK